MMQLKGRRYLIALSLFPGLVIGHTFSGGLQSLRSPYLVVSNQEVILGLEQVKIISTYTNNSVEDITETLVFTLPSKNEDNQKQFAILINQAPVPYQTIQHAVSTNGRDISRELKALGLPFNPIAAMHVIDASANRVSIISKLRDLQAIDPKEDTPTWSVNTYYFWQQKIPAKSSINIEQSYKPTIMSRNVKFNNFASLLKLPVKVVKKIVNVAIHWTFEDDATVNNLQQQFEKYYPQIQAFCPRKEDYQILVSAYKQHKDRAPQIEVKELSFGYATEDLWANPINHFQLTIDSPKNMHPILCWNDNLKRNNNNSLQFSAENYVPLPNISVLYIEK